MNKNKGFTLIELLGTIVIIGILGTIAVTSVVNIKKSSNIRFDNSQVELMKQAGQTYFTDNKRLLPIVEGQINYVTLDKLIEKGYINKLYNSKKEEFDPTTSYAWVQKQNDGSYKYDCYCEIKGEKLAGTTAIPESKENNSIVTFEYKNFYNNKSANKYYTNGKNNSIVKIHLNRNEVSEYRYEIYKKDTKNENSQYKISQREKLTTNLVNIKLNAKDYSDGEYFIKVTTYNSTGNSKQSSSSAKIYVDKTPPTCSIESGTPNGNDSWYKNDVSAEIKANDNLSGLDSGETKISYGNMTSNAKLTISDEGENKKITGAVSDNAGNTNTCSKTVKIDKTPPSCPTNNAYPASSSTVISQKNWSKQPVRVVINPNKDNASGLDYFEWWTKDDSNTTFSKIKNSDEKNIIANTNYTKLLGNVDNYEGKAIGLIRIYDKAGNVNDCQTFEYWIDRKKPEITTFKIESDDSRYNTVTPNITVKVNDKYNVKYGFYSDSTPITSEYTTKDSDVTLKFSELHPSRIDNFCGQMNSGYNGATYTVKVSATDEAGNTNSKSATYTVYTDCTHNYDNAGTVTSCDNDWSACTAVCGGGIQYATGNATWKDEFTDSSCSRKVANGCPQNCNTQDCCSSTYIGDYGDWGDATGTACGTLTEYRDVYYYSNYNNQYCYINQESQSYSDSTWTDCGDWGKCNSNNKKKKTCNRISDYDDSTVCSTFEKKKECSHTPNVPCDNSDKVFGTHKGSNAGNFGKWVNISFNCNRTTPVVGGYVRKCIIDDCEGMTAEKVNNKFGCSYSKYWCNSSNPNKKKW